MLPRADPDPTDEANLEIAHMICREFLGDFAGPCEIKNGCYTLEARFMFEIFENKQVIDDLLIQRLIQNKATE